MNGQRSTQAVPFKVLFGVLRAAGVVEFKPNGMDPPTL